MFSMIPDESWRTLRFHDQPHITLHHPFPFNFLRSTPDGLNLTTRLESRSSSLPLWGLRPVRGLLSSR